MKMKIIIQMVLIFLIILMTSFQSRNKFKCNYVSDEETAIKVAEAILVPIYGKEVLQKRPFIAKLIDNKFWRVKGTINSEELGGIPIVEIQMSDGKILNVTHTK